MKIACIGWGSLIWDKRDLMIKDEEWLIDGPIIPVEFIRVSSNNRVTLVIDLESNPVTTLWNLMATDDLSEAIESLKDREGTSSKNIHFIGRFEDPKTTLQKTIQKWLKTKSLDYAIWTGLGLNQRKQVNRPLVTEIIDHLKELEGDEYEDAKNYILKSPKQINTEYRKKILSEFNWPN